jgi:hypothetical protein
MGRMDGKVAFVTGAAAGNSKLHRRRVAGGRQTLPEARKRP